VTTPLPLPNPTVNPPPIVNPPHESETPIPTTTEPASTTAPSPTSGFWPWSSERKWVWIYGSIAGIAIFVSIIGVWYCRQRRKARILQTHGAGLEAYEFEELPNEGDEGILAGDLYDAFAGGEEFIHKANGMEHSGRRRSGEEIGDHEMGGFLADSEAEVNEEADEKDDQQRLLREDH